MHVPDRVSGSVCCVARATPHDTQRNLVRVQSSLYTCVNIARAFRVLHTGAEYAVRGVARDSTTTSSSSLKGQGVSRVARTRPARGASVTALKDMHTRGHRSVRTHSHTNTQRKNTDDRQFANTAPRRTCARYKSRLYRISVRGKSRLRTGVSLVCA